MSYRCQVCGAAVAHNVPLRKHVVYEGKAIRAEIRVCLSCDTALWAGNTLQELRLLHTLPVKRPSPQPALVAASVGRDERRHLPRPAPAPKAPPPPRCDVCGEVVIDGQVTPESTLCAKHLPKRRR